MSWQELGGSLAVRRVRPATVAIVPTSSAAFGVLLVGVVVALRGLTYPPALVLGPVAQQLLG